MKKSKQLLNQKLTERLQVLNALSDNVANLLQIDRNQHTLWVVLKRNHLTLMTDNSSLANQLRFQEPIIAQYINKKLLTTLKKVKVKVITPKKQVIEVPKEKCFRISAKSAGELASIADGIKDETLRTTLKNLGSFEPRVC
ncbi:MAG: DUF721 domain-containing protein [Cocleimonas sp.]|nr:DUF721 domain-containing protein [Cocleimonas sp.]